jgi:hypothetical protein
VDSARTLRGTWRNFVHGKWLALSDSLAILVFDAHIPLVREVRDLTPLQKNWLIAAYAKRNEKPE